jgi:hypothetical protein
MAIVPYTATIPYIASDAQPLRLHAQCRSAGKSRLFLNHRFTHVGQKHKRHIKEKEDINGLLGFPFCVFCAFLWPLFLAS